LQDLDTELNAAFKTGDFSKVAALTDSIAADAAKAKLAPGEQDAVLKTLFSESGYDAKPTVLAKAGIDAAAKDGATLMVRGVKDAGPKTAKDLADQFRSGDYFTGNGIYGNGTYVGHSGTFVQGGSGSTSVSKGGAGDFSSGRFIPGNSTQTSKDAWKDVARHSYLNANTANMRMALPADANIVTATTMKKEVKAVQDGISAWAKAEKKKLQDSLPPSVLKAIAKGEKDFKASIDVKGGGFVPTPGAPSGAGFFRFAKKDGSGVVEFPGVQRGKDYYLDRGGTLTRMTAAGAKKFAVESLTKEAGLKAGGPGSSIDPKKLKAIDKQADAMREFLIGDQGEGTSGRLAVIRGYDAVALNNSYQANSFMLLLNRSKVMVQDTDIDFATGQKIGVGVK
jgi:hypothetical protein